MLDVALLGTSGMMPLPNRFLTSFMCRLNGKFLLIDCGEGTQITMKLLGWGFKNLDCICITHFHADHIAGLPGLLLTIGNSSREEDITIIGPKGIKEVVRSLLVIAPELPFGLNFVELENDYNENIKVSDFYIESLKLEHNIDCYGYKINVPRIGKFNIEKAKNLDIPVNLWSKLQNNEVVVYNGNSYLPSLVMGDERKGISVCYITDTRPFDKMIEFVKDADLYVGEGIYNDNNKLQKAIEYKHSLFSETAEIAKKANVKELWLTHFSPSITDPFLGLVEIEKIFSNAQIGFDRKTKTIFFEE